MRKINRLILNKIRKAYASTFGKSVSTSFKVEENLKIYQFDVIEDKIDFHLPEDRGIAFYSRFFIHTLTEAEVLTFFENLAEVMKLGDLLFIEYRNEGDSKLVKETPDHFRAFYQAKFISELANQCKLECIYHVEGIGFAKWRHDDASVTRQSFKKCEL